MFCKRRHTHIRRRGIAARNLPTLIAAVVIALVVGGSAYAAGKISGSSIENNSIPAGKLTKAARSQLSQAGPQGPAGPTGPTGPTGSAGARGETGAKGDTGATGDTGAKGDTGDRGEKGEPGDKGERGEKGEKGDKGEKGERGEKGEKGDTGPTEHNYGVANTFVNSVAPGAPLYTSTIPPDHNNGTTASGTTVIACSAGEAPCKLTVRGVIRSDNPAFEGQAGGGLIITNASTGALVAVGQTPTSVEFPGTNVAPVETVTLRSLEPVSVTTGSEIPLTWVVGTGELAAGNYILHGTIEFFNFI